MNDNGDAIKTEILRAFESGKLVDAIFDHSHFGDAPAAFCAACVELHNEGAIDVLALTETVAFAAISGPRFFAGQHVYCQAIPKLNGTVADLMRCVHALVSKGGQDLVASQPNGAFKAWCAVDLKRAYEVIRASPKNDPLANNFLTFALEAADSFEEAKQFLENYPDERRLFAITALGRMNYHDDDSARRALSTLLAVVVGTPNDALIANILIAAFAIKGQRPGLEYTELTEVSKSACAKPGPAVHHACARLLTLHGKILTSEILAILFDGLASLDVSHTETINVLDVGLSQLLHTPLAEQGIDFVTTLVPSKLGALKLSQFRTFEATLMGHEKLFHKALVCWLLSAEISLCEDLGSLLLTHGRGERPLNISMAKLKLSPVQQFMLCRKAVGYFFFQPVVASSILLSVLRTCDKDLAEAVRDLLFDPLLHNYGIKIRQYLIGIESADAAYEKVQFALKRADDYIDGVQSVGIIKELHPSESHRQTVRIRDSDDMRKAHKGGNVPDGVEIGRQASIASGR